MWRGRLRWRGLSRLGVWVGRVRARLVVLVVAIVGTSICGLLSALLQIEMVDKINAKLPEAEQLDAFEGRFDKWMYLREYKKFYPEGPLLLRFYRLTAVGIGCMLIGAFCIFFWTNG